MTLRLAAPFDYAQGPRTKSRGQDGERESNRGYPPSVVWLLLCRAVLNSVPMKLRLAITGSMAIWRKL